MTPGSGDPGSVSALGGTLRGHALRLADVVADLERSADRAARPHRGAVGVTPPPSATAHESALVTRAATELDRVGALLQAWTSTDAESSARARELEAAAAAHDLEVVGNLVVERPGPSRADAAARLAARERLQDQLSRVTSLHARELARLARELEAGAASLAALSDRARSGP